MKITGAELIRFMDEAWPGKETNTQDDWFWDHELFDDRPKPDEMYETSDIGTINYQGSGSDPTNGKDLDLDKLIRKWRKTRDCEIFTVAVPKDRAAEFKKALPSFGASLT